MIYTLEDIKDMVMSVVKTRDVRKVILFGSYARGEATSDSDIDLIIEGGESLIGFNFFEIGGMLNSISPKFSDVYEIREINKQSPFYQSIIKDGVVIYDNKG